VPRDIATREIFDMCVNQKMGVFGQNQVYLDVTHIDRRKLDEKLRGVLEIYEKFVGDDPRDVPMRIFPAVHYSMGGLWVNDGNDPSLPDHMTNIPGLFAVGECDYQYHGANRLGANSLLSCLTSGQIAGPAICAYADGLVRRPDGAEPEFAAQTRARTEQYERLRTADGPENPFALWHELGTVMTENMTVVRYNDRLRATEAKLAELQERYARVGVSDASGWTNQVIPFTRQLGNMLVLARVMTRGALLRDESRGAHYKPDFPERDDARFLQTTIAEHAPDGPKISYESVDVSQIKPRPRKYTTDAPAQQSRPGHRRRRRGDQRRRERGSQHGDGQRLPGGLRRERLRERRRARRPHRRGAGKSRSRRGDRHRRHRHRRPALHRADDRPARRRQRHREHQDRAESGGAQRARQGRRELSRAKPDGT
jgi:succinate dehydrogenase / fumarate reductase flavoprotein subunit